MKILSIFTLLTLCVLWSMSAYANCAYTNLTPIELKPVEIKDFPTEELSLPVTHGGGMFNPVFLPFAATAEGVTADEHQSLTFPSMLGFKFLFVLTIIV